MNPYEFLSMKSLMGTLEPVLENKIFGVWDSLRHFACLRTKLIGSHARQEDEVLHFREVLFQHTKLVGLKSYHFLFFGGSLSWDANQGNYNAPLFYTIVLAICG